jgi:hypothetical protein
MSFERPHFLFFQGIVEQNKTRNNEKKSKRKEKKVSVVDDNIWDPMLDDEEDDW